MTEVKILVYNINDVVHRAAFEKEVNVYLKMGWTLRDTHQAVSPETGYLMMTAILEKEAEEEKEPAESGKQGTLTELAEENKKKQAAEAGKEKTADSGKGAVKEPAKDSDQEKEEGSKQEAGKEEESSEEKEKDPETKEPAIEAPKGFKIKEKKEEAGKEEDGNTGEVSGKNDKEE